jgi:SAM-dependent methyltransferase
MTPMTAEGQTGYKAPTRCPVCDSPLPASPLCGAPSRPRDASARAVADAHLWRCRRCHYIFQDPDASVADSAQHFDNAGYVLPENETEHLRTKQRMFEYLIRRTCRHFDSLERPRTLVDFGCSYGHLGKAFQAAGWNVLGVDISWNIALYFQEHHPFPAYEELDSPDIPTGKVDAISMIDVLYYVDDPVDLLRLARSKLATPGVVLLRLANRNKFIRMAAAMEKILPLKLLNRVLCDHTGYWTVKALRIAARRAGFDRVRIFRREHGYDYPWPRKALHWTTQLVSCLTGGLVDFATVFHAELWKGKPR